MALEPRAGVRKVQLRPSRSGARRADEKSVAPVVTKKRAASRKSARKSIVDATAATVDALRAAGELGDRDEASVAMVMSLAEAVAADATNAALWREYRAALGVLREAGGEAGDDGDAEILSLVQSPVRPGVGN